MSKTREILNRINSISKTRKITQAMKMVSVSKLAKSQTKFENLKLYSEHFSKIFNLILYKIQEKESDFNVSQLIGLKKNNSSSKKLLIIISSDKGLCSSFNLNLFKKIEDYIEKNKPSSMSILPIGKKGFLNYKNVKNVTYDNFVNILNDLNYQNINKLVSFLIEKFDSDNYSEISIAYNEPKGKSERIVKIIKYMPFEINTESLSELKNYSSISDNEFIFEPEPKKMINSIYSKLLKIQLFEFILSSIIAEHSARIMAMTKATDNAEEMIKELRLNYNRTRQAGITKELSEIVGGAEALKGGH